LLRVESLNVYYDRLHVLKDINFEVKEGEIFAIIGANGAGKTTLLRSIMGLKEIADGKIIFKDQEITELSAHERAKLGISLSFEGGRILKTLSVEDNLRLGAYLVSKEKYQEKLEFVYDLFPRLEERKKQIAGSLSGGERQMLSISRALMSEPSLLMLDEPSFGLAPKIVIEIFHVLEKLNRETGLTMLVVEQNVKQALKIASRAMVIEAGYEVTRGTPEEILNNREVIEAYLG